MSYGSYYQSDPNYYRNPVPYMSSDIGVPVPGWGTSTQVAGPARLGVGQIEKKLVATQDVGLAYTIKGAAKPAGAKEDADKAPEVTKVAGLPWWTWPIAAAAIMGGLGYYGTKKGWF